MSPTAGAPHPGLAGNPWRLCAYHALQMSLFPVAILTLFLKAEIGLSMAEIMLLQGLFGLSMVVCEFPSGYVADRIGYRPTLAVAAVLMTLGWCGYVVADSFAEVLAAEITLGLAMAAISGSDSALLYESLRETGHEAEFGRWTGRMRFCGQAAEGTAALAAGFLYAWSSRAPFALEIPLWIAAAVVALRLVEPSRTAPREGRHVDRMGAIVRRMLRDDRSLRRIVGLTIALGMASFVPVWMVPLYATGAGVDPVWIGPIWALANYSVAIGSLASDRAARRLGLDRLLLLCIGLVAVGYLGLGGSTGPLGFAFYFCLTSMRGLFGPALLHREQRLVPSGDRAGFLSLRSLLFRLAFLGIGPLVGAAADVHGQRPVLLALGGILVAANLAIWRRSRVDLG